MKSAELTVSRVSLGILLLLGACASPSDTARPSSHLECGGKQVGPCVQGDCVSGSGEVFPLLGEPHSSYRGQFNNGVPNGRGIAQGYGWEYDGTWKDCRREGPGRSKHKFGNVEVVLEGAWVNNSPAGKFEIAANGASIWSGYYCQIGVSSAYLLGRCSGRQKGSDCRDSICKKGDCMNGPGTLVGMIERDQVTFEGSFKDGLLDGHVVITTKDGSKQNLVFDRCQIVANR